MIYLSLTILTYPPTGLIFDPSLLLLVNKIKGYNTARVTPRALKCLVLRRELPNAFWKVNFTTITRLSVTLNADFFYEETAS